MNKKEQTGIFVRITKGKADKRLNKEVKEFIKKKQKEYGGELSKEEKKELRHQYISGHRRKIIKEEAKKAKIKVAALGMASMLGIVGVGGYTLGVHNSKILGITDGKEKIEVNMDEVEKNVENMLKNYMLMNTILKMNNKLIRKMLRYIKIQKIKFFIQIKHKMEMKY